MKCDLNPCDEDCATLVDNGNGTYTLENKCGDKFRINFSQLSLAWATVSYQGSTVKITDSLGQYIELDGAKLFPAPTLVPNKDGSYTYNHPQYPVTIPAAQPPDLSLSNGNIVIDNKGGCSPETISVKDLCVDCVPQMEQSPTEIRITSKGKTIKIPKTPPAELSLSGTVLTLNGASVDLNPFFAGLFPSTNKNQKNSPNQE